MKEIEVKFLEINKEQVIKRIENLGGKKIFDGDLENIFFDFEDERLRKNNVLLRLRRIGSKSFLTVKTPIEKKEAKIKEENETEVGKHESMTKILNNLGLFEVNRTKKHRTSYTLDGARIEFDTLEGIPTYLEIEAPSLERLKEIVKKIGFSMNDAKNWSENEVIKHYKT